MRFKGAGYRRYSSLAKDFNPQYNRHWYRHVLVAFSPGGIIPLPFPIWLGFPDGLVVNCYHLGMVRYFLLESCRPDDKYLLSVRDDLIWSVSSLKKGTSTWRKSCLGGISRTICPVV